tara:strand:- start:71 stop:295 length:225 start_codon:yes stop_codon:yes gene_type:complete
MKKTYQIKTNKGETVSVSKDPNETGKFQWVVTSGELFEDTFRPTKKAAIAWAENIVEVYNHSRRNQLNRKEVAA